MTQVFMKLLAPSKLHMRTDQKEKIRSLHSLATKCRLVIKNYLCQLYVSHTKPLRSMEEVCHLRALME